MTTAMSMPPATPSCWPTAGRACGRRSTPRARPGRPWRATRARDSCWARPRCWRRVPAGRRGPGAVGGAAHHIYGFLFGVLAPLLGGGVFATDTVVHPEAIADRTRLERTTPANVLCSVPPHVHGLRALAAGQTPALRRLFCSGGRLPAEDAAAVHEHLGLPITEVLGSTETGGMGWRLSAGPVDWTPLPGVASGQTPMARCSCVRRSWRRTYPSRFAGRIGSSWLSGGVPAPRSFGRSDKGSGPAGVLDRARGSAAGYPGGRGRRGRGRGRRGPRERELWAAVVSRMQETDLRRRAGPRSTGWRCRAGSVRPRVAARGVGEAAAASLLDLFEGRDERSAAGGRRASAGDAAGPAAGRRRWWGAPSAHRRGGAGGRPRRARIALDVESRDRRRSALARDAVAGGSRRASASTA